MFAETNWLAVVVAALASMVIGFIWYHPRVFGTSWMKASGMTPGDAKTANMPLVFGVTILMSIVVCSFLSTWVHPDDHIPQFFHGAHHGLMLAAFIAVPPMVINAMYEKRSLAYILINTGYAAVTMALQAGILFIWPTQAS